MSDLQWTIDVLGALTQDARQASSELTRAAATLASAQQALREMEDPAAAEARAAAARAVQHIRQTALGCLEDYIRLSDQLRQMIAA
jgi:hypothetical protein